MTFKMRRRRNTKLVERIDAWTTRVDTTNTVPLRPIVGTSGEFVGWTRDAA